MAISNSTFNAQHSTFNVQRVPSPGGEGQGEGGRLAILFPFRDLPKPSENPFSFLLSSQNAIRNRGHAAIFVLVHLRQRAARAAERAAEKQFRRALQSAVRLNRRASGRI